MKMKIIATHDTILFVYPIVVILINIIHITFVKLNIEQYAY